MDVPHEPRYTYPLFNLFRDCKEVRESSHTVIGSERVGVCLGLRNEQTVMVVVVTFVVVVMVVRVR